MINSIMFKVYLIPMIGVCMHFSSYREGTFFSIEVNFRQICAELMTAGFPINKINWQLIIH